MFLGCWGDKKFLLFDNNNHLMNKLQSQTIYIEKRYFFNIIKVIGYEITKNNNKKIRNDKSLTLINIDNEINGNYQPNLKVKMIEQK